MSDTFKLMPKKSRNFFVSALCVDMSTTLTRYVFTVFKLDILSLRADSIWDKAKKVYPDVCYQEITHKSG